MCLFQVADEFLPNIAFLKGTISHCAWNWTEANIPNDFIFHTLSNGQIKRVLLITFDMPFKEVSFWSEGVAHAFTVFAAKNLCSF